MDRVPHLQNLLLRSRRLPWLILGVTLGILAGTILLASLQLRGKIREQIAGRDGEILNAVALMQQFEADLDPELVGSIAEPGNQLLVILKTARLKGVLAARRFDAQGRFAEVFPLNVREAELNPANLPALRRLKPVSHFHAEARMDDLFYPESKAAATNLQTVPLLEVNVPLHEREGTRLVGIAQFLLAGQGIAAEYAQLDRHLWWQGAIAFLAGSAIILVTSAWAFRRLRQAQRLLTERTNTLLRANQELALAAKTSAVGAVTAHLIHGLKNPLSGLQSFVNSLAANDGSGSEADWQEAVATARRMQNLINEVVSVLREEGGTSRYELTVGEVVEIISSRLQTLAKDKGVEFSAAIRAEGALPSRVANLLILILLNLLHNALEATPKGKRVSLAVGRTETEFAFEVRDQGAGIAEALAGNLFQPCHSNKAVGSGLGLAISKQLANHLGAVLELKSTGPEGSVFSLRLPVAVCQEPEAVLSSS